MFPFPFGFSPDSAFKKFPLPELGNRAQLYLIQRWRNQQMLALKSN